MKSDHDTRKFLTHEIENYRLFEGFRVSTRFDTRKFLTHEKVRETLFDTRNALVTTLESVIDSLVLESVLSFYSQLYSPYPTWTN